MEQSKYQPLYLKHRPQALGELVGQGSVVKTLTNAIENKRIAHAYLFTGPRGTGKTSSARILAKSLNCEIGPTVTPCLTCSSCVAIKDSSSPSVFEIDAASNNSVDDARMIIERAPLVAAGGRFKMYIVDECHMLTKEAFNALLKTIEEPPPGVIFILATTEEHKVPPTILSRCQRLMFRLVNLDEQCAHLAEVAKKENIEIDQDALDLITRRSGGGMRDALGLLDQASLLARPGEPVTQKDLLVLLGALDEDVLLAISKGIMDRNGKEVLDAITGLVMQGREPALVAQELAKHFLNLTKASYITNQSGGGGDASRFVLGSAQYLEGLIEQAKSFERVELTQMVEILDELEQSLKRSTQPSMTLEIALLSLCHRHDIASVKQLEERINQLENMIAEGGDISRMRAPSQGRPASGAPPQSNEVLPHHRPPSSGPEVLPHRQPGNEVLPHHRPAAAPANEALPHHRPPAADQPVPYSQPAGAPVQSSAAPQAHAAPTQPTTFEQSPPGAPTQSPPDQTAPVPNSANSDSEEEDGAPDVVVSSVQTLPALPPAPALIFGDDDDDDDEPASGDSAGDGEPHVYGQPGSVPAASEPAYGAPTVQGYETPAQAGYTAPAEQANAAPPPQAAPQQSEAPPQHKAVVDTGSDTGEMTFAQLERLWSDLLDALHKRSIPAYSLVSMHAFPVRYEAKTLTLGVNREFFQKSIENKTNNIVVAYKDLTNEEIRVVVKVMSEAPSPSGGAPAKKSSSGGNAGGEPPPQPQAQQRAPEVSHRVQNDAATGRLDSSESYEASRASQATATMPQPAATQSAPYRPDPVVRDENSQPAERNRPLPHTPPPEPGETTASSGDEIDPGKLKEAYKIFEGPGSRLIS